MNLGIPKTLKTGFPGIYPSVRSKIMDNIIKDPNWIVGFTNGEGCFFVYVVSSSTTKLSETVRIKFQITQHARDSELMKKLVTFFQCGRIESTSKSLGLNFVVIKFKDITDKVIPFFDKYSIEGIKTLNFLDFKRVAGLMKNKAHLTKEGLHEIRFIKSKMNYRRSLLDDQKEVKIDCLLV
jgi:LAGLIDADG endonuclease